VDTDLCRIQEQGWMIETQADLTGLNYFMLVFGKTTSVQRVYISPDGNYRIASSARKFSRRKTNTISKRYPRFILHQEFVSIAQASNDYPNYS
jgi:hypothetical protein